MTELAGRIPQDNFELLKSNLRALDKAGSGRLNYESFVSCLKSANMNATQREVELLVMELDEKKQGCICYEEFVNCCFLSYLFKKELSLRILCESLDTSKNGTITLGELRKIIESQSINLSVEQLDHIFKIELGVDITQISAEERIDYKLFIECLRKEF